MSIDTLMDEMQWVVLEMEMFDCPEESKTVTNFGFFGS